MNLEQLTHDWLQAKADENAANKRRVEIEVQIAASLPPAASEQTVAQVCGDYKIAVRYGVTRKVDTEALQTMWDKLPAKAQEAFKWTAAVTLPQLRALQEFMPADYAKLAGCIETKPSKPSISIEAVEKEAA